MKTTPLTKQRFINPANGKEVGYARAKSLGLDLTKPVEQPATTPEPASDLEESDEIKTEENSEVERVVRRSVTNMGELQMLLSVDQPIYIAEGLEKVVISQKDLLKIPFGEIREMLKTYKLFR